MSDDYRDRIARLLAQHEISAYRFERGGKHRAVLIEHRGTKGDDRLPGNGVR